MQKSILTLNIEIPFKIKVKFRVTITQYSQVNLSYEIGVTISNQAIITISYLHDININEGIRKIFVKIKEKLYSNIIWRPPSPSGLTPC